LINVVKDKYYIMDISKSLFNLLVGKNFTIKTLDAKGKPVLSPEEAEMFSFDYEVGSNNYGTVVILLNDEQAFEVYYGDNVGKRMEEGDKGDWYDFLYHLRMFAKRNLYNFSLRNINQLKYSMQGMSAIKEGLFEGWNGTSKTSYNNKRGTTRLKIQHSKQMHEGDQRWRAIEKLFVETADGERFKLPFKSLQGGRAMARHVQEGGNPYDVFGEHIVEMVREINTLSKFVRATKNITEDDTQYPVVESGRSRYKTLRQKIKQVQGKRGYHSYINDWSPEQVDDKEEVVNELRGQFTQQSLDTRIEEALPILAKIQDNNMKELNEFENWADQVTEGTWAIPDTEQKIQELNRIMGQTLEVGIDAENATNVLYDIIGDDDLFDSLEELAQKNPRADARPLIVSWINANTHDEAIQRVKQSMSQTESDDVNEAAESPLMKVIKGFKPVEIQAWLDGKVAPENDQITRAIMRVDARPSSRVEFNASNYRSQAADQVRKYLKSINEVKDIDTGEECKPEKRDPMLEMSKLAGLEEDTVMEKVKVEEPLDGWKRSVEREYPDVQFRLRQDGDTEAFVLGGAFNTEIAVGDYMAQGGYGYKYDKPNVRGRKTANEEQINEMGSSVQEKLEALKLLMLDPGLDKETKLEIKRRFAELRAELAAGNVNGVTEGLDQLLETYKASVEYRDKDGRFLVLFDQKTRAYIVKGQGDYRMEISPQPFDKLDDAIQHAEMEIQGADEYWNNLDVPDLEHDMDRDDFFSEAAPTKLTPVRKVVAQVLGDKFTWEPGYSKSYKNTRRSKTQKVDDYVLKGVKVDGIPKSKIDFSANEGDKMAVALKNALTQAGYDIYDDLLIFPHQIMFQVRTPISVSEEIVSLDDFHNKEGSTYEPGDYKDERTGEDYKWIDDETGELFFDKPEDTENGHKKLSYKDFVKGARKSKPYGLDAVGIFGDIAAGGGDPIDYLMTMKGMSMEEIDALAQSQGFDDAYDWAESYQMEEAKGDSFRRKFNKAMFWDYSNPKEMMQKLQDYDDDTLMSLLGRPEDDESTSGSPRNAQVKMIKRELRRRGHRDFEKYMTDDVNEAMDDPAGEINLPPFLQEFLSSVLGVYWKANGQGGPRMGSSTEFVYTSHPSAGPGNTEAALKQNKYVTAMTRNGDTITGDISGPNMEDYRFQVSYRGQSFDLHQSWQFYDQNKNESVEEVVTEKAPPGMEKWIKDRKPEFKKRYGDKWQEVLYATAWKQHNKNESLEEAAESPLIKVIKNFDPDQIQAWLDGNVDPENDEITRALMKIDARPSSRVDFNARNYRSQGADQVRKYLKRVSVESVEEDAEADAAIDRVRNLAGLK